MCLSTDTTTAICTIPGGQVSIITEIQWPYYVGQQGSGNIGFGFDSPIWVNRDASLQKVFSVQLANPYTSATTPDNKILMGTTVPVPSVSMTLSQSTYSFFGFGKTYEDGTVYYEQLATVANET